ncbi:MAG: FtsX-like permease family protein [Bryobacteraceae bacterium]
MLQSSARPRTADLLPLGFPIDPRMDLRLLAFSIALGAAIAVLCGLLPGYFAAGRDPARAALASRGSSRAQTRLQTLLVTAQVALCFVLISGAALFSSSSRKLLETDTGFRAENVLMIGFDLPRNVYDKAKVTMFQQQLLERVRALPGVMAASLANSRPLERVQAAAKVIIDGKQVSMGGFDWISGNIVTSGYFPTVGIDIVRGRAFTERDGDSVAIVSQEFVRRFLPGREAVGATMRFGHDKAEREIVGVASDATYRSPADPPQPYHYQPWVRDGHGSLLVRTAGSARALLPSIEREVRALDPQVPLLDVSTLDENKRVATAQVRTAAWLASGFGALSLVLAVAGIYGVIAFSVARRRHEIGVRMAIGARGADVARDVVTRAVAIASAGAALGVIACIALGQAARPFLYGVAAWNPAVLIPVALMLATAAASAALGPALLAARVDPVDALRRE